MTKNKTNPMIAFDTWVLGAQARNQGMHVYASKLLSHFREMGPQYSVEIAPYVCSACDNDANQFASAPGFSPQQTRLLKFSRSWRWGGANLLTSMGKADLVFSPASTTLYFGYRIPSVVTIHDVIPLLVPWGSKRITRALQLFLSCSARFSRAVITVSQHSRTDLLDVYGLPESKVSVIYNGYDRAVFNDSAPHPELLANLMKRLGTDRPYLLHHGTIKPNKNLKRLIQAYRFLLDRNRNLDFDLVLAGPLGWEYDDVLEEAGRHERARGKVIFTYALSDTDLAMLVKGASLAVIPSLYEGFCLPMVESMACGVPTIASKSSCLPEISGGVLRYFDPQSVDEMAACMEEVLENETLRKELSVRGLRRADDFDWRLCAEQTLAVLARVAHDGRQ